VKREGTTLIFQLSSPYDVTDEPNYKTINYSSSSLGDDLQQPEVLMEIPRVLSLNRGMKLFIHLLPKRYFNYNWEVTIGYRSLLKGAYHLILLGWIVTMTMGNGSPYLNT
jgi:hypothetical protein